MNMNYTVKLTKADTECLRQTVAEAYNNGKEHSLGDDTTKKGCGEYFTRILRDIEVHAQRIAEEAFEAGRKAPPLG